MNVCLLPGGPLPPRLKFLSDDGSAPVWEVVHERDT
jgi:hypothetical protein